VLPPSLPAISLFSNCGAGDIGYARAGFRFQVLAELQARRLDVAGLNHREATVIPGDLRVTWPSVVEAYRGKMKEVRPALLSACPPCQGMSSARSDRGLESDADAGTRDKRNLLVEVVADVARALEPRLVVVENVQAFLTRQVRHPDTNEPITAAQLLTERLEDAYVPFVLAADLADFGVPQVRKRAFLSLVHRDEPGLMRLKTRGLVPFPRRTHGGDCSLPHVTLRQALDELDLPPLDSRSQESAGEGMHRVPVWTERQRFMVASIPADSGASAWTNTDCQTCGKVRIDSEAATCPNCGGPLARPVRLEEGNWRLVKGFRNSSYRRMHPDRPASTITTANARVSSDYTIHPSEHRVLSIAECQHLQTIPEDFDWGRTLPTHGQECVREMIGEAVPPQFTELHGRVLASLLRGHAARSAMHDTEPGVQNTLREPADSRPS
jgi:DNA (cytosine-5)-methyltransferase 1